MDRPLILTIICFFASMSIMVGLVWPEYQDLQNLQLKVQEKDIELQSRETYFSQLKHIADKFKNYEDGLDKIDSALPQDASLPGFFDYIQKVTSEKGLVLENIGAVSSTTSEGKPNIQEHLINISVIGPYPSFKNFLAALEKSSRLIEIKSISFHSPKEEAKKVEEAEQAEGAEEPEKVKEAPFTFNLIIKTFSY